MRMYRQLDPRSTFRCHAIVTLVSFAAGLALALPVLADDDRPFIQPGAIGQEIRPQQPDEELESILRQVDPARLQQTVQRLVGFGTRNTLSSQTDPVRGIGAAAAFISAQLQAIAATSGGRMTVQSQTFVQPVSPRIPVPTTITNVLAKITGSDSPARVYVITAYYDSRVTDVLNFTSDAPGADSDASGVAAVLELARIFATHAPKATIVLSLVAGREQGLFGSTFEAIQFAAAGTDIEGMFSLDRIGSSIASDGTRDPFTMRLFTEGTPDTETPVQQVTRVAFGGDDDGVSRQLGRFALSVAQNEFTQMRIRHIYRRDLVLRASDQVSFLGQGYAAARFSEPHENYNHEDVDVGVVNGVQLGDLPEFLDFDYMARATRVVAAVVWSLSQGPAAPKNVLMNLSGGLLSNDTNLTWSAGTEPDLAGYEVVWRETSDEDWTHFIRVGNVTTVTLPLFSKYNVFFGVRAVNSTGHHSPVTFPVPST